MTDKPSTGIKKSELRRCLEEVQLETAVRLVRAGVAPDPNDFDPLIRDIRRRAEVASQRGEIGRAARLGRAAAALLGFRNHGPDPSAMIADCDLAAGYRGKVLLVLITGGVIDRKVCLRSGDAWHREILRNTENEIRDLGFASARVYPLGGAHVRFVAGGNIEIAGSSAEYGACDRRKAAQLMARAFPGREIVIQD